MAFKFEIESRIGVISTNNDYAKEVNLISWNGRKSVIDIRQWRGDKPLKGITVTKREAEVLIELLKKAIA